MVVQQVLMVCTGNICRSPMAEGLMRTRLPGVFVSSAGIQALVGKPATEPAVALMRDMGIDIAAHRARQISSLLVQSANLVLTAELRQKQFIERQYPAVRGRVFRMCEASRQDVPDPYRQDLAFYQQSLALMEQGISDWIKKIGLVSRL